MTRRVQPKPLKDKNWEACRKHFLASLESEGSRSHYQTMLERFFAFVGHREPQKVVYADIVAFCSQAVLRKGERVSPSPYTYNLRLATMRSFYRFATNYEVIRGGKRQRLMRELDPTAHVKQRKMPPAQRDLTEQELRAFFAAIPRDTPQGMRDRALFLLLWWTGKRNSEGTGLLWGDLEQVIFMEENGSSRAGWRFRWQGKGRVAKAEWAELPTPAVIALKEYLEFIGRWGHMAPEDALFPALITGAKRTKPLHPSSVDHAFQRYAKIAGLHKGACVHSLRWEAAWQRWLKTKNIMIVSKLLGHKDISTTQHYLERRESDSAPDPVARLLVEAFGNL